MSVPPRHARGYTYGVSITWLPKHDLNMDDANRHAEVDGAGCASQASILDKELQVTKERKESSPR